MAVCGAGWLGATGFPPAGGIVASGAVLVTAAAGAALATTAGALERTAEWRMRKVDAEPNDGQSRAAALLYCTRVKPMTSVEPPSGVVPSSVAALPSTANS